MSHSIIGNDASGNEIPLEHKDRLQGLYIIGASGMGKSTEIENLVLQDIRDGLGLCVIEPHSDLIHGILSRLIYESKHNPSQRKRDLYQYRLENDVILLDLTCKDLTFGLNLYECNDPNDIQLVQKTVNRALHIFSRLYDISRSTPQMSYYLRNIAYTIIANKDTVAQIPDLLAHKPLRDMVVPRVPYDLYPSVHKFWSEYERVYKSNYHYNLEVRPILNKLDEFIQPIQINIFGQSTSTITMRQIMDERKILLVRLDKELEDLSSLIGATLISNILNAAYSRSDLEQKKRRQFNVYADEFQNFATEDFATLFTEARKFGIGLTISHQVFHQIPGLIKATCKQAANVMVFRVSDDDADEIAGIFDCSPQPGLPQRKQQETPVLRPINFMADHGVHHCDTVRGFMRQYGKKLVDEARVEEQIQGEARRELVSMAHNSSRYGPGSAVVAVTHDKRERLEWLNDLLYEAMIAGKQAESIDTIAIDNGSLDNLLKGIAEGKTAIFFELRDKYFAWKEQYLKDTTVHFLEPTRRIQSVKDEPEETPLQIEARNASLREQEKPLREQVRDACEDYLRELLTAFYRNTVIIKGSSGFFMPARPTNEQKENVKQYASSFYIEERFVWLSDDVSGCLWHIGILMVIAIPILLFFIFYSQIYQVLFPTILSVIGYIVVVFMLLYRSREYDPKRYRKWKAAAKSYFYYPHHGRSLHVDEKEFLNKKNWIRKNEEILWGICYSYFPKRKTKLEVRTLSVWRLRRETFGNLFSSFLSNKTIDQYLDWVEYCLEPKKNYDYTYDKENILQLRGLLKLGSLSEKILPNPDYRNHLEEVTHTWEESIKKRVDDIVQMKNRWKLRETQIPLELDLLTAIMPYKYDYDISMEDLRAELRQMMKELSEFPVEAPNGIYQDVPMSEISSTEVEARIANELKQLPKYTARVRLTSGEHTISTIKPTGYVSNEELKQCITEIQERNKEQGYLRLRSEVEAERKRQEPESPPATSPAPNKPKPPTQPPTGSAGNPPGPHTQLPTSRKRKLPDPPESL